MTIDVGMLWFDNDEQRSLAEKVLRAAKYYNKKYGLKASLCYVHPNMVNGVERAQDGRYMAEEVEIRTTSTVLPNHFWIGCKEESA